MKRRKMVNLNGLAFIILLIGLFSIPKEVNGQSAEKEGEAAGTGTNDDGSAGNAGDDEAGGNDDQQTDGEKTETGDDKTEEEGSGDGGDENQQNNEEEAAGTGTGGETDEPKPEGQQGGNQGEGGGQEDGAGDETAPKDGSAETQDGVAGSQEDGNAGSKEEGSEDGGGKDEGVGEGTEKGSEETKPGSEETKPSTDGAGAVQRFPVLNGQNRVHLCIRPSPNTKYWDLWRYNNMSSVSPLQPYRQRLPPSQWLNENGQAYYAPYHVGDNRRVKRQANINNNNNMNWQDQVPQICTILQENINTNGFDRARQARKRRRRRRRAIHPSIINE